MIDDEEAEFYETLKDHQGRDRKVLRSQAPAKQTESGFTHFDDSHGHCALCGSISCNGGCFK